MNKQPQRQRLSITGCVQGVGFRPHVFRVASRLNLTGWVKNDARGVMVEIQGHHIEQFLPLLQEKLPALAKIHTIQTQNCAVIETEKKFIIRKSSQTLGQTQLAPDTAICQACLQELFDPNSRYFRYPFLNCTQCGPRMTVTYQLPYDRAQTSMRVFPLCGACRKEYENPNHRRYHAQPTACVQCGPRLSMDVHSMANALIAGKIVAIKGLGGYQLVCDAHQSSTLTQLREKKARATKPFALMALNLESAAQFVEISEVEKQLLLSAARPIVLLKRLSCDLPESIAPGLNQLGIMLPSTPLHYLLFHALAGSPNHTDWLSGIYPKLLVVTSANLGSEPLIADDTVAMERLPLIADEIVTYDRQIVQRLDDSVIQVIDNAPAFIRRARGFVPEPIPLPAEIPCTLALGGHLKNTFCLTRGDEAFISPHIGSLTNASTIAFFHETLLQTQRFLGVKVACVAHDWHPDFYTSRYAATLALPTIGVAHHHAHLASVMAEHHLNQPVLGLALDGFGYGLNGELWGGELFYLEHTGFKKLANLKRLPCPGGEAAVREPWRMGAALLSQLGHYNEINVRFGQMPQSAHLARWLRATSASQWMTSSCGRWFDAVSALLGVTCYSQYEGEAARKLESLVTHPEVLANGWSFDDQEFMMLPTFTRLLDLDAVTGANLFHGTLIAGLSDWVLAWTVKLKVEHVVLSGGCFLNQILAQGLIRQLKQVGLNVYLPQALPANDGGLSLGQAWIAGRQWASF